MVIMQNEAISLNEKQKEKLKGYINAIRSGIDEQHSLTALLTDLENLIAPHSVDLDDVSLLRKKFLSVLNDFDEITELSRQLWGLLSTLTKVKPINDVNLFDLTTPTLCPTGEARKGWFYASSGHAFPLWDIVKCRHQNYFVNPYLGAESKFNLHDQKVILQLAKKHNIAILTVEAEAQRFLHNLHQRALIMSVSFSGELIRDVPVILAYVKEQINNRNFFSGLSDYSEFIFSSQTIHYSLAVVFFGWCAYAIQENSLIGAFIGLNICNFIVLGLHHGFNNIVKKYLAYVDHAFKLSFKVAACLSSIGINLYKESLSDPRELFMINLLIKNNPIMRQASVELISRYIIRLNNILPNNIVDRSFKFVTESYQQFFLSVVIEKGTFEFEKFKRTSPGRRAEHLYDTGLNIFRDMSQEIESGLSANVQSYFTNLGQQMSENFQQIFLAQLSNANQGQGMNPAAANFMRFFAQGQAASTFGNGQQFGMGQ